MESGMDNSSDASLYGDYNSTYDNRGSDMTIGMKLSIIFSQPDIIISAILSPIGLLMNGVSIISLLLMPSGLTTRTRLVLSLTVSDALFCTCKLTYIILLLIPTCRPGEECVLICVFTAVHALLFVSNVTLFLTMACIGTDYCIATEYPQRYGELMGIRRGKILVSLIWVLAIGCGYSTFLSALATEGPGPNYCPKVLEDIEYVLLTQCAMSILCLNIIIITYSKIYWQLRAIRLRLRSNRTDSTRDRKALVTALLVVGTFLVFFIPFSIINMIDIIVRRPTSGKAGEYLFCMQLVNCISDPLIFTIRNRDVQQGYQKLKQCFSCPCISCPCSWLAGSRGRSSHTKLQQDMSKNDSTLVTSYRTVDMLQLNKMDDHSDTEDIQPAEKVNGEC